MRCKGAAGGSEMVVPCVFCDHSCEGATCGFSPRMGRTLPRLHSTETRSRRAKVMSTAERGARFTNPYAITVDEYLNKWLELAAKPRLRERTLDDYEEKLNRYVRPVIGAQKVSDVRSLDVQGVYSLMAGRSLSPRTIRYTHAILASAIKQAVRWNMLLRNPCAAVELPRLERKEMQALSPAEVTRFLNAAAEDEHTALFAFAVATGMRPEEYLALKWTDVDLEARTATVTRTLVWRKGGRLVSRRT